MTKYNRVMIIKIQIIKSVVIEAVKSATYLKAKVDSASDDKAIKLGFQEAAGDDEVHERTLTHDFQTALEVVKTILAEYLVPTSQTIGDNIIYYTDKTDDIVELTINASRRCNGTLTDTLARLTSKYIEDYMIFQWWLKTTNLKQAEPYQASLSIDEQSIRRCFVLSGPAVPTVPYTKTLTAKVDGSDTDGGVTISLSDGETSLSYEVDDGAIDDIEARCSDSSILEVQRCAEPHSFCLKPKNTGVVYLTLFSRHSDRVKIEIEITVAKEASDD